MKRKRLKIPAPGIQGDYQGSCLMCLNGCDTGMALNGEAEWVVAGLMHMGIPSIDEAIAIVGVPEGCAPGMVPDGILTVRIKLCESCAQRSDTKVAPCILGDLIPCYYQHVGI